MPQRNRAAVNIRSIMTDPKLFHRCHRDNRERFINLQQIHIPHGNTQFSQQLLNRSDRSRCEPLRLLRTAGITKDARNRPAPSPA